MESAIRRELQKNLSEDSEEQSSHRKWGVELGTIPKTRVDIESKGYRGLKSSSTTEKIVKPIIAKRPGKKRKVHYNLVEEEINVQEKQDREDEIMRDAKYLREAAAVAAVEKDQQEKIALENELVVIEMQRRRQVIREARALAAKEEQEDLPPPPSFNSSQVQPLHQELSDARAKLKRVGHKEAAAALQGTRGGEDYEQQIFNLGEALKRSAETSFSELMGQRRNAVSPSSDEESEDSKEGKWSPSPRANEPFKRL